MTHTRPASRHRRRTAAFAAAALASLAVLAAGCAKRDSITVGSVPDDYRTNHPIVISEQDVKIDIPVGLNDHAPGRVQKAAIDGFIADYDHHARPLVTMLLPSGSGNQAAAASVASGLAARMNAAGVQKGRILTHHYDAANHGDGAPIRVSYTAMKAGTGKCGRWPEDIGDTTDNKHWANFGCSYQNNLAAQIANPADLLGPRRRSEIDAENRSNVIDTYRDRGISDEFFSNSEVFY